MTNLSTLLEGGELERLALGSCAAVIAVKGWRDSCAKLLPKADVHRAMERSLMLADLSFDTAVRTAWCSRLIGRDGLFEIRINGVRFYGGRVGQTQDMQREIVVIVFAGSEQKAGKRAADAALLDQVEREVASVREKLKPDPKKTSNVVAIGAAQGKRK